MRACEVPEFALRQLKENGIAGTHQSRLFGACVSTCAAGHSNTSVVEQQVNA
jgi:hypothetical protein